MITKFYLTHRGDPNRYYFSGVRLDLEFMTMNISAKIQLVYSTVPTDKVNFSYYYFSNHDIMDIIEC